MDDSFVFESFFLKIQRKEIAVSDPVISQQQVVIKPLGKEVNGLPGIVGASILGDGKAAFILDLCELVKRHRMRKTTKTQIRTLKQEVA